jgi:hypothetical protein
MPWVTAGDRSFPAVLARTWHGACWSDGQGTASGIVELMSSKTARLRRRQAAQRNKYKRLRKSGRVPRHTRAERRRAAAERQRQQGVDQRRQERRRQVTLRVVVPTIVASFMFVPLAEASSGHHSSLYLSAAELARAEAPDLPHMPERDMTFYASLVQRGARVNRIGTGQIFPGNNSVCRPSTL